MEQIRFAREALIHTKMPDNTGNILNQNTSTKKSRFLASYIHITTQALNRIRKRTGSYTQ